MSRDLMEPEVHMNQRIDRQRGWVGMIVMLIALAIVAWLSKDALLKYAMLSGAGTTAVKGGAATAGARAGAGAAGLVDPVDPASALPSSATPIEKARAIEGVMQRAAETAAGKLP
jgi:hypothetical protein